MALKDDGATETPLASTASAKPPVEFSSRPKPLHKWNADDSLLGGMSSSRFSATSQGGKMEAGQDRTNRSFRSTNSLPLRAGAGIVEQVSGDTSKTASSALKREGRNNRVQFEANNKKPDGEADGSGRSSSVSIRRLNSRNMREKVQLSIELWKERMKKKSPPLPSLGSPPALVIPNHRRAPKDRRRKKIGVSSSQQTSKSPTSVDAKGVKKKTPAQDDKKSKENKNNDGVKPTEKEIISESPMEEKTTQMEAAPATKREQNETIPDSVVDEEKKYLSDQDDMAFNLRSVFRDESVSSLESNLLSPSTVLIDKQAASESGNVEADDMDTEPSEPPKKTASIILQNMVEMELKGMETDERDNHIKRRQRQEIYALNRIMTSLELAQFEFFCREHNIPSSV